MWMWQQGPGIQGLFGIFNKLPIPFLSNFWLYSTEIIWTKIITPLKGYLRKYMRRTVYTTVKDG